MSTPELTDEWVQQNSTKSKTVEEFRKEIRDNMENSNEESYKSTLRQEVLEALMEQVEVKKLPQDQVDEEYQSIDEYYKEYAQNYGMEFADFLTNYMSMTEEEFAEKAKEVAETAVKRKLACELLAKKKKLEPSDKKYEEEIARYQKMVDRLRNEATLMTSASRGRTVHAKQTHLDRLEARKIKQPFVELRQPDIHFPEVSVEEGQEEQVVLKVENYQVSFEDELLKAVNFEVKAQEKVAIVGPNGTGKTTLLRDIYQNANPAISFGENVNVGFLSQLQEDTLNEENTIYEEFEALGFEKKADIAAYLETYCFDVDTLVSRIEQLSGGEKNLLQLAKLSLSNANFLILDEPTSHLDTYSQIALEKAISEYKGAVLMVSHDFYNIVNCADYVLFAENHTIRRMRVRAFRKMIYQEHFDKDYLELEQKKKELETRVEKCLQEKDFKTAKKVSEQLEEVILKM